MLQGTGYGALPCQTCNPSGGRGGGGGYVGGGGAPQPAGPAIDPATDQPDCGGSTLEDNVSGNNGNDKISCGQPLVVPHARERSPAASHYDTTSGLSQSPARKRARMLDMGSIRSTDNDNNNPSTTVGSGTTMVLEIDDQLPPFRRLTGDEDGECQKKKVKVNNKDLKKVERDEEEVDRDLEKAIRNRDNEIRDLEKTIRNQEKINRDQKMVIKKLKKKMKKLQDILSNPEDPTQTLQRCKGLLKKMTAITD